MQRLSRRLSFPLTVAHAWPELGLESGDKKAKLCVLGAREEASDVTIAAWLELCVMAGARDVSLSMIGPEAEGSARGLGAGGFHVKQEPPHQCSFADSPLGSSLLAGRASDLPDAFVLFNPGLHAGKYFWRESMEAVLGTGLPILFTAYTGQDAASDARWLSDLGTRPPAYADNPWASLEPWGNAGSTTGSASNSSGEGRANKYVAVLNGRGPAPADRASQLPLPQEPIVPGEAAWLRRSAHRDMWKEGPRVFREALDEMWGWRR